MLNPTFKSRQLIKDILVEVLDVQKTMTLKELASKANMTPNNISGAKTGSSKSSGILVKSRLLKAFGYSGFIEDHHTMNMLLESLLRALKSKRKK